MSVNAASLEKQGDSSSSTESTSAPVLPTERVETAAKPILAELPMPSVSKPLDLRSVFETTEMDLLFDPRFSTTAKVRDQVDGYGCSFPRQDFVATRSSLLVDESIPKDTIWHSMDFLSIHFNHRPPTSDASVVQSYEQAQGLSLPRILSSYPPSHSKDECVVQRFNDARFTPMPIALALKPAGTSSSDLFSQFSLPVLAPDADLSRDEAFTVGEEISITQEEFDQMMAAWESPSTVQEDQRLLNDILADRR